MERLGGWRRDFKAPQAPLRWLVTMAVVISYFCRATALIVMVASTLHLTFCWFYYVGIPAYDQAPSGFSDFNEFRRFIFRRPEFKIWYATTKIVVAALVSTFFPKGLMALLASSYLVGILALYIYVKVVSDHSEQGQETRVRRRRRC